MNLNNAYYIIDVTETHNYRFSQVTGSKNTLHRRCKGLDKILGNKVFKGYKIYQSISENSVKNIYLVGLKSFHLISCNKDY